jgi:hypothetical protein
MNSHDHGGIQRGGGDILLLYTFVALTIYNLCSSSFFVSLVVIVVVVITAKNEFQRLLQHLAAPCRAMVLPGLNVWLLDGSSATDRAGAREGVRSLLGGVAGGTDLDRLMVTLETASGALRADWQREWSLLLAGYMAFPLNHVVQLPDGDPAISILGSGSSTNVTLGAQSLGTTTTVASTEEDDGSSASDRKRAGKRPQGDKDEPAPTKRPRDDGDGGGAAPGTTV